MKKRKVRVAISMLIILSSSYNFVLFAQETIEISRKVNGYRYRVSDQKIQKNSEIICKIYADTPSLNKLDSENQDVPGKGLKTLIDFLESPDCPSNPDSILWIYYQDVNIIVIMLNEDSLQNIEGVNQKISKNKNEYHHFTHRDLYNFLEINYNIQSMWAENIKPKPLTKYNWAISIRNKNKEEILTNYIESGTEENKATIDFSCEEKDFYDIVDFIHNNFVVNSNNAKSKNLPIIQIETKISHLLKSSRFDLKIAKFNGWVLKNKKNSIIYSPDINNGSLLLVNNDDIEKLILSQNIDGDEFIESIIDKKTVDEASIYNKKIVKKGVSKNNILIELANQTEL